MRRPLLFVGFMALIFFVLALASHEGERFPPSSSSLPRPRGAYAEEALKKGFSPQAENRRPARWVIEPVTSDESY